MVCPSSQHNILIEKIVFSFSAWEACENGKVAFFGRRRRPYQPSLRYESRAEFVGFLCRNSDDCNIQSLIPE